MRALLPTVFFTLLSAASLARSGELLNARAPNGRYMVKVVASGTPLRINYEIVSTKGGAVVHQFRSSYQPEPGYDKWAWDNATGAEVSWSPDSRYVAIDEENYRFIGHVFLSELGDTPHKIPFPEQELIERTHMDWERHRIRIDRGWLFPRSLSLVLAGHVFTGMLPDGRRTLKRVQFHFVLRFGEGKAVIARLDKPEDA